MDVKTVLKKVGAQKKKGSHKEGRNKKKCAWYRDHRYRKNKMAKLKRHLSAHPLDSCAATAKQKLG